MIKSYFLVAYRNILRHKGYAIINILGLAIGLACTILIGIYVFNELSYDRFHAKSDRIYRVFLDGKMGTNKFTGPSTPIPMAEAIVRDYPEVEAAFRLDRQGNKKVIYKDKVFYEDNFFYADSSIFNVFSFDFISGNRKEIARPNTVVITDEIAQKYFSDENPLGKSIKIENYDTGYYEIVAVVKKYPFNSHFHFDFIASTSSLQQYKGGNWVRNNLYTYILMKPGQDANRLEAKFPDMVRKYCGPEVIKYMGISIDDFMKSGNYMRYNLQKLTDIHLYSNMDFELEPNGNILYIYIFFTIALFILLNACINFTNLATARSAGRAKEVGLRKVFGGQRKALIIQFLSESVLICFVAIIIAVILVEALLPYFANLVNPHMTLPWVRLLFISPILLLFVILVGVVAGGYPAFYLSSFIPAAVLKGQLLRGAVNSKLRSVLVVVQFTISIFILLGTFIVSEQLRYIQNKKLGFDKESLVVIERTDPIKKDIKVFMEELKSVPEIKNVTLTSGIPGRIMSHNGYIPEESATNEPLLFAVYGVNTDYINTMGIKLKDGRFFSEKYPSDSMAIVINEAAAKYLGFSDPIGKRLINPGVGENSTRQYLTIIGVIDDFHFESLHKPINPMILFMNQDYYDGYITVRIEAGKHQQALSKMKQIWQKFSADMPIQFFYFDQEFEKMYKSEFQTRKLLSVFSVLAIIIAMLGLFGLVSFIAERRTREIGLRKVLGSSAFRIVLLLSKNITFLVTLSFLIASIAIYFCANWWLQKFAYKIGINTWVIFAGGGVALLIAWITISYQTFKAATRNPSESLHYE